MRHQAWELTLFVCHMLALDSNSVLLTPLGPKRLEAIKDGELVLCMSGGSPKWVGILERRRVEPAQRPAVLLYTAAGSLCLAPSTRLVCSGGLCSAGDLLERRNTSVVGRMEGDWPPLERALVYEPLTSDSPSLEAVASRFADAANIGTQRNPIFRLGAHEPKTINHFAQYAVQRECSAEPGLTGWTWLLPVESARPPAKRRIDPKDIAACSLALWQPVEEGRYRLPLELTDVASYTMGALYNCGALFDTEYRPRYLPAHVELQLLENPMPHASLQGAFECASDTLTEVRIGDRGCYLVVSGLLCSQ